MKNELSRIDKINRIKNVLKGKQAIRDILPTQIYIWYNRVDDLIKGAIAGKLVEFTEQQYQDFIKGAGRNGKHIVFRRQKGNEPLKELR